MSQVMKAMEQPRAIKLAEVDALRLALANEQYLRAQEMLKTREDALNAQLNALVKAHSSDVQQVVHIDATKGEVIVVTVAPKFPVEPAAEAVAEAPKVTEG